MKKKRKSKAEVKKEFLNSSVEGDEYKNDVLNGRTINVRSYRTVILMAKVYETIIKRQKRNTLSVANRQGCIFKRFKESDKFLEMVKK